MTRKTTHLTKTQLFSFFIFIILFSSLNAQVLEVSSNNSVIANGDTSPSLTDNTDFGSISMDGKIAKSFIVKNTGTAALTFATTIDNRLVLSGSNADQFVITSGVGITATPLTLQPNTYLIIEVRFKPTTVGLKKATLTFESNNIADATYSFDIQGTATSYVTPNFKRAVLAPNLNFPTNVYVGPDNHLWISERAGKKISRFSKDGTFQDVLIDLSSVNYQTVAQDGLMGFIAHPNLGKGFGEDFVYVAYTYNTEGKTGLTFPSSTSVQAEKDQNKLDNANRKLRIVRYSYSITGNDGSLVSPQTLIDGITGGNDHNSGRLIFGPDNKLYYTVGDHGHNQGVAANRCNPIRSQDIPTATEVANLNYLNYQGKTLRLNLDGTIPVDNPTINGVKSHTFTYGHRNASGLTFGKTGILYSSEHGPNFDDELNILESGKNYGWPHVSGYKDDKNYKYLSLYQYAINNSLECSANASNHTNLTEQFGALESSWSGTNTDPISTWGSTVDNTFNSTIGPYSWPTIAPSSVKIYDDFAFQIPGWNNSIFTTTLKNGRVYRQKLSADGKSIVGDTEELFETVNRYRDIAFDPDGKTIYLITDTGGSTSAVISGSTTQTVTDKGKIIVYTYEETPTLCSVPVADVASLPTLTDTCSIATITPPTATNNCSSTGGIIGITDTVFPITTKGITTVIWNYNYGNGQVVTQNQTVIIDDMIAPTLPDVTAQCTVASLTAPTTTDTCKGIISGTTTTTFPITTQGTTVVVWTFDDGNGNSMTANQNVIIDDTVAPTTPTLANMRRQCSVTPTAPTATDACKGIITGTTSTSFPITTQGTTVVVWTFDDGNGNSITANQKIILTDTNAPITPILADVTSQCTVTTLTAPTTTDACKGIITGTTTTTFPITAQGTTVVVWTFNDGNGNSITANQNVIIDNSMTATISGTSSTCSAGNSRLQVIISGGISPYTVEYSNGTSNFIVTNYTNGSSILVSPFVTTTYTLISVTSSNGCMSQTNSGTAIISPNSTTWNGSSWSNGTPTTTLSAIISGNYNSATNINACSLTVNNNAVVTIPSGYNVTLNGAITVSSGSLTLENNANLIQTSNVANTGNIIVKRNSSALLLYDYTAWSSPVTNNNLSLQNFSPSTASKQFFTYNTSTNSFTQISSPSTTIFGSSKGYLIRVPNSYSTSVRTIFSGVFTGVPNNGTIHTTMTNAGVGKRFNMIGNPYPSPISMTQFVAENTSNITGTLYFWRRTNGLKSQSYCTWNNGVFVSNGQPTVINPNGIIQTGQGFFVEAKNSATSVTFNNNQRVANNANQFFKTKSIERNTIWLNATSTSGDFSQMALSYAANGTQGVDENDGLYLNDGEIALNSVLDNSDYVIQSRALPFDRSDEVPLSFNATNPGEYTISIDHVDGLFLGTQDIVLKDNIKGAVTDLKTGGYTFTVPAGKTETRFTLKYQKNLKNTSPILDENNVLVYKKNGEIHIKANGITIANVKIYDVRGRLLAEKSNVNASETKLENYSLPNQVLIIKIVSIDNKTVSKKLAN